tara:strand:+ start:229 stop:411 length:183 start_codon:yes stop_codon:yes gene_type:complete
MLPPNIKGIKNEIALKNIELRDKIAIEAMKELLKEDYVEADYLAEMSYKVADAMIKERNK